MDNPIYRFAVGDFTCTAVSDGTFNYPLESFFAGVPREQVEETLRHHGLPTDRITTPYTCLFVDTGDHRVMIDTGAGNLGALAPSVFPSVDHSTTMTGQLLDSLGTAGLEPGDVNTIIITHAHPDHIGGMLNEQDEPVFAGARYVIGRQEWEFWSSDRALETAPPPFVDIARRNIDPVRDRLTLVEDGDEIVSGMRAIATPGHTPGHLALEIFSRDATLLHISDVVLHPLHLEHPEWVPVFDMLPDEAAASKQRIFDCAAEEEMLVFGHHFPPFPSVGHVHRHGAGWRWRPLPLGPAADQELPGQR